MSRFKNAVTAFLAGAVTAREYFKLPPNQSLLAGAAVGVSSLLVEPLYRFGQYSIRQLRQGGSATVSWIRNVNYRKNAQAAVWAISPTNPDQNILLGTVLVSAANTVRKNFIKISDARVSLAVDVTSLLAGAAGGQFLSNQRIKRGMVAVGNYLDPVPPLPPKLADTSASAVDNAAAAVSSAANTAKSSGTSLLRGIGRKLKAL